MQYMFRSRSTRTRTVFIKPLTKDVPPCGLKGLGIKFFQASLRQFMQMMFPIIARGNFGMFNAVPMVAN